MLLRVYQNRLVIKSFRRKLHNRKLTPSSKIALQAVAPPESRVPLPIIDSHRLVFDADAWKVTRFGLPKEVTHSQYSTEGSA